MTFSALITGSNRGIGLALTKEFLENGHRVLGTTRTLQSADLQALQESYPKLLDIYNLDIAKEQSLEAFEKKIKSDFPHLDILINNAAIFPEEGNERFEELNLDFFEKAFRTNVGGTAKITKILLPLLRKSKHPKIVNISSGTASISEKEDYDYYCYSTSKAALNMFTRALAAELIEENIIVTAISPGWVQTDMGGPNAEITAQESAQALYKTIINLTSKDAGAFLGRNGSSTEYQW